MLLSKPMPMISLLMTNLRLLKKKKKRKKKISSKKTLGLVSIDLWVVREVRYQEARNRD